jgi:uncharacterized membrane protein/3-hydroxymyristoyl/3-hydroxydecanoyl-(acyl carrier protein) dehydratase
MRAFARSRRMATVVLAVAYPVLAHASSVLDSRALTLASVITLAAAVLAGPLIERRRWALFGVPLAALLVAALWKLDRAALVLLLPPVLLNAYLAWLFGHTLARGSMPLIGRLVRLLQPRGVPPEPGVYRYARRLTALWTALFVALAATNLALAAIATPGGLVELAGRQPPVAIARETWSLFANVLNYVLVGAAFLLEFAYRRRRFPGRPYRNLFDFFVRSAAVAPALIASLGKESAGASRDDPIIVETMFRVPSHHPAFAGHFPARPVLPAVVLLDRVIEEAGRQLGEGIRVVGLPRAKFLAPLAPGDRGTLRLKRHGNQLEFELHRGEVRAAQGVFELQPVDRPP